MSEVNPDESVLSTASAASQPQGSPKERHSLTLDQRRALRRWAISQTTRPSHKACIEWFFAQYGQNISQSTISHSLSPKYARLDSDNQFSGSRLRFGNWPDVEKLVLLWHGQVVASGRNPSNDELAEKAKSIFSQLPRYKDEAPPEFSPGWIHRFKKRYGLLIRRQRRHGSAPNPAEDIPYLADAVPRFMNISQDTSPAAIRDSVLRVVGVEAQLGTCARVRDEVLRRIENPNSTPIHPALAAHVANTANASAPSATPPVHQQHAPPQPPPEPMDTSYAEDDPEVVLQNALRQLQQDEADAEAEAAAVREERTRAEQGLPPANGAAPPIHPGLTTPNNNQNGGGASGVGGRNSVTRFTPVDDHPHGTPNSGSGAVGAGAGPVNSAGGGPGNNLNLTPISSGGPASNSERPVRCPFCVNQRMLRTIKEAVEHLSTHVVV